MEAKDPMMGESAPQYNPASRVGASSGAPYGTPYGSPYGAPSGVPYGASAAAAPAETGKKVPTWLIPLVVIVVLLVIAAWSVSSCTSSLMNTMHSVTSSAVTVKEQSVAVISLDGEIGYNGTSCSPEGFKGLLDEAEANPLVKAVVLRVNSGGGTATAGEEMTTYLQKFGKPVVVSCAATNASAAYMISSQADYIYTAKSSAVGAIGVAMQLVDYSGLMQLLGISTENITSSSSKDSTYGTRGLTDEERAEYQHQVDQINEVFIDAVAAGRHMGKDRVRELANGMTYTGLDAVANGLVDEVGTLEDACAKAASLAGVASYDVVYFDQSSFDLNSLLGANASGSISVKDLALALKELN